MERWVFFRSVLWVLALGAGLGLCPPGVRAGPASPPGPAADAREPSAASPENRDRGFVGIQSDEPGDRFVDEDGDGLDDRHMRRRHRGHMQRGYGTDQRGSGSEHGETGSGGQAGGQAAGRGGSGRGPR